VTLVDTSVWVQHFRRADAALIALLDDGQVLSHPFVIGELACAGFKNRDEVRGLLSALPSSEIADHHEVLQLVDQKRLFGHGIGWIDAHLLASCLISGCALRTNDKPLRAVAASLGVVME
jgi:predicted nucleic acid-binding protein